MSNISSKWIHFTFVEGYEYEDESELNIRVYVDYNKEFYIDLKFFGMGNFISEDVLTQYPIEIVDSGIISENAYGSVVTGWVNLLVFEDTFYVELPDMCVPEEGGH